MVFFIMIYIYDICQGIYRGNKIISGTDEDESWLTVVECCTLFPEQHNTEYAEQNLRSEFMKEIRLVPG